MRRASPEVRSYRKMPSCLGVTKRPTYTSQEFCESVYGCTWRTLKSRLKSTTRTLAGAACVSGPPPGLPPGTVAVGPGVGFGVGPGVGLGVGFGVGLGVGPGVGLGVGFGVGLAIGLAVGRGDGI